MMDKNQSLQILNRDTLKIIAAAAMLIDHIGWRFYPFINLKAQVFHVLGRITLPITVSYTHLTLPTTSRV